MTADPLQAAAAHIDPVLFAEALAELDWTPHAELKELVDIAKNNDSVRHKLGAMQILRSRIIENLQLSGAIQIIQERIRGQLPGGQYTAERSRYLSSDAASSTHKHLKTLSTERLDVSTAPSTPDMEKPNDDDPAAGPRASRGSSRSDSGIRQDDLADDCQGDGPQSEEPDERPPTANTGGSPKPASGAGRDIPGSPGGPGHDSLPPGGTGHPGDPATATPPAEGPEAEVPADPVCPDEVEATDAESPFKLRKPESRPAFGRPLGRRTPTKPTIGGGICGPADTDDPRGT